MTAMMTSGINYGNKGWRLALRHVLGDVAQHELFNTTDQKAKALSSEKDSSPSTFSLFDLE